MSPLKFYFLGTPNQELNLHNGIICTDLFQGWIAVIHGNLEKALMLCNCSSTLFEKHWKSEEGHQGALILRGFIQLLSHAYSESEKCFKTALQIFEKNT